MSLVVLSLLVSGGSCANILGVFPTPSYSHQSVFAAYVDKLAAAGHNVTVITPMKRATGHVREIDCSLSVERFQELVSRSKHIKKRGAVADEFTVTKENYMGLINVVATQLETNAVTALIKNPFNKFDLVVCEAYLAYTLIFGHIYDAPVIQLSSGHGIPENFEIQGAIARDYVNHPNIWRSTFTGSPLEQMFMENYLKNEWGLIEIEQEKMLRKRFGYHIKMENLKKSVLMLFINVPAVYDNFRPVTPTVQYLGGLHLRKEQPIRDLVLNRFLESHSTIVYASFGSGIDVLDMDRSLLKELIRVFSKLPYGILWKVDDSVHSIYNVSANVYTKSWFPQRDLLKHENVKAFITQAGVQSADEAIDGGVPMITLPMMGDQFYNAHRFEQLGIGIHLDVLKLEKERLDKKIVQVVENRNYKKNIERLRHFINDVPLKSLRKSLWYTNYVIRKQKTLNVIKNVKCN
ncbi:ORF129 [Agrotis segetum granulovirus]|uniref:Ecdysteroid UDP-glucosyltransferase n=1 Tax=Agrotis segetum granulosis virus TaxID=10464 RepID=Q6QXI9_GVAS|nr:egt [Agrotis segetum granulovirus]AAS82609.1 ORF129 [Agrotis segetum granulovirus]AHN92183.1 egt [Agrotis segetum granulovirus]AKN63421.1 egt [Agrotis segetum granulovirus]